MSILLVSLLSTPVQAAEFQVGAGLEALAFATQGDADAGLGQVEVDGLLSLGSVEVRADLDVGNTVWGGEERIGEVGRGVNPEWGAVLVGVGSWRFAAGFQPLPTGREQVDPWRNASVVYSQAFTQHYAGGLLGLRGQWDRELLSLQVWGGGGSQTWNAPAVGGGVLYGDEARAGLELTAFPIDSRLVAHAHGTLPLASVVAISGELFYAAQSMAAVGTLELVPQSRVVPVIRGEWGGGPKPWAIDAGAVIAPMDSVRVTLTGRAEGDQIYGFVALSLVDEQPSAGWRL